METHPRVDCQVNLPIDLADAMLAVVAETVGITKCSSSVGTLFFPHG